MTKKIQPARLMDEKSLFHLYLLSFKFPLNKFNLITTFAIGFICSSWIILEGSIDIPVYILRKSIGFGYSIIPSVLGFLIAGFTVFVTFTKPGVFSAMARREFSNTGQSYLKYNMSAFVLAFFHYLVYLSVVFILLFFGGSKGFLKNIVIWFDNHVSNISCLDFNYYFIAVSVLAVLMASWTWYLLMLLKSFVYNVYQVVITGVRWDLEEEDRKYRDAL